MKHDLGLVVFPRIVAAIIRALNLTMRIRHLNTGVIDRMNAEGKRYILAFWHSQLLMMVVSRHGKPISVMVSQHRDGELITRCVAMFGVECARGSTSRAGSGALRTMLKLARAGYNLALTPDGPRGPRHVAQAGVVTAAQLTGNPIIPMTFTAPKKTLLRSWDRFEIPHLFSRGLFIYGDPIEVPRELDEEGIERYRLIVERALNEQTEAGDANFDKLFAEAGRSGR